MIFLVVLWHISVQIVPDKNWRKEIRINLRMRFERRIAATRQTLQYCSSLIDGAVCQCGARLQRLRPRRRERWRVGRRDGLGAGASRRPARCQVDRRRGVVLPPTCRQALTANSAHYKIADDDEQSVRLEPCREAVSGRRLTACITTCTSNHSR